MINKTIKILNKSQKTMSRLNEEYHEMSIRNKKKSLSSQKNISQKSTELAERKGNSSKHFEIIRNK